MAEAVAKAMEKAIVTAPQAPAEPASSRRLGLSAPAETDRAR
jgi:hypothetical protein